MKKRYICNFNGKHIVMHLNENIKRYDIYINNIYQCTCFVHPLHGRKEAIERFKELKKGFANYPDKEIETRLICII